MKTVTLEKDSGSVQIDIPYRSLTKREAYGLVINRNITWGPLASLVLCNLV